MLESSINYRPGVAIDSYTVFHLFEQTLADLNRRLGDDTPTSIADPAALARMWAERRGLYEHLADSADQFWIAEQDGRAVGYARSILGDGLRQLTELFVLPEVQSGGVGRALLERTFPAAGAKRRSVIASPDVRAQALYLRAGVYPQLSIYYWWRKPEVLPLDTTLVMQPVADSTETLALLDEVDQTILNHRRTVEHRWLLSERQGHLYYRGNTFVGYGYTGVRSGPFALLDTAAYPAVLAHAETVAAQEGRDHFGLEVPMSNHHAMDHLLARHYRLDSFIATLMSDCAFGRLENYILTSPPFFL